MSNFEFTDRYAALGLSYPDPKIMCRGQCEGVGVYPYYSREGREGSISHIYASDGTDHQRSEVDRIKAESGVAEDGYYFIRCEECGGTGKRIKEAQK